MFLLGGKNAWAGKLVIFFSLASAIHDATDIWFKKMPVTTEDIGISKKKFDVEWELVASMMEFLSHQRKANDTDLSKNLSQSHHDAGHLFAY